jgi:hypothetical protein
MKKNNFISACLIMLLATLTLILPEQLWAQQPLSPGDSATAMVGKTEVKIKYFSPAVRDRQIWGNVVEYDKVWRTGANNATVLELSNPVRIEGKNIPAGKYALFTIPRSGGEWTVILNKTWDQWGAYNYDENQDVHRFEVKPKKEIEISENLKFYVNNKGNVKFEWEYLSFDFDLKPSR